MPRAKRLDDFDLSWLKGGLPLSRFEELKSLSFIERKENIIFLGPSGVGKTHLMLGLGQHAWHVRLFDVLHKLPGRH